MRDQEGEYVTMERLLARTGAQLGKNELVRIRARAMRRGVWFRVLTRAERAQIELTTRVVKRIRSFFLARVVTFIVEKLLDAMESKVTRLMREVGPALARKLSRTAQEWGNESAVNWTADPGFGRYLTVMYMNTLSVFKT
jgi:hypothetical protein